MPNHRDDPATGCVPMPIFMAPHAARFGPAMFLTPLGETDICTTLVALVSLAARR